MRIRTHRPDILSAKPWLLVAFLLGATVAGATEPAGTGGHRQAAAAKPRIGRIFFSPAERTRHRSAATAMTASSEPGGSNPVPRERRVVNGALRSGTEGRAVWVNGTAVEQSARDKSAWTDRNGNVWLMNGTEGTHLVKPGQSVDRNGVIEDLLPSGSVARR